MTTENRAVFAPMPSARVRIAMAANPGDFRRTRIAYGKSCDRIDMDVFYAIAGQNDLLCKRIARIL